MIVFWIILVAVSTTTVIIGEKLKPEKNEIKSHRIEEMDNRRTGIIVKEF